MTTAHNSREGRERERGRGERVIKVSRTVLPLKGGDVCPVGHMLLIQDIKISDSRKMITESVAFILATCHKYQREKERET